MKEIEIIKYLIEEIEEEQRYNEEYKKAEKEANAKAEIDKYGRRTWWTHMPDKLNRAPRESVIKANAKKIRQLSLKLY